jgi:MFS family permease
MPHVNWLAVLVAALSSFLLGGIWYSALFAKAWQAAAGVSDEAMRGGNKPAMFAGAFALSLIQSVVFAFFEGPSATIVFGAAIGFAAGLCWVSAGIAMTYIFEKRSLKLLAINGGYATLQFTLIGTILGAWH